MARALPSRSPALPPADPSSAFRPLTDARPPRTRAREALPAPRPASAPAVDVIFCTKSAFDTLREADEDDARATRPRPDAVARPILPRSQPDPSPQNLVAPLLDADAVRSAAETRAAPPPRPRAPRPAKAPPTAPPASAQRASFSPRRPPSARRPRPPPRPPPRLVSSERTRDSPPRSPRVHPETRPTRPAPSRARAPRRRLRIFQP